MSRLIYKATHKVSGKVYIGITKDKLKKRIKDHLIKAKVGTGHDFHRELAKAGLNSFVWEVIDVAISNNEAAEKERKYIYEYARNVGCYNADRGGGIKKNIYQFDVGTGRLIRIFKDLKSAAKAVEVDRKTISKACLGEIKTCVGYYWSYSNKFEMTSYIDRRRKRVEQYTLNGNLVKTYRSVSIASRETDISKIFHS